jgi:hypothetical protein
VAFLLHALAHEAADLLVVFDEDYMHSAPLPTFQSAS